MVNRTIRFLVARKEAVSCHRRRSDPLTAPFGNLLPSLILRDPPTSYPRPTVLNSVRPARGRDIQHGEERSLNFPTSSLTCRVLILKFVVPATTGRAKPSSEQGHGMERGAAPHALAEALGIRLEFIRDVSSAVTSSQERCQFCFIAHGRESFSETLLLEVPSGRVALPPGDEIQRF